MIGKVLILGGNGFIGKHLIDRCLEIGLDCVCVSLNKVSLLEKKNNVEYFNLDLKEISNIKELIGEIEFDYIVNLSGYIDHSDLWNGGIDVFNNHFGGLLNVLKTINLKNLKRIIQIGSSDEYGKLKSPQNEQSREAPISLYSLAKFSSTHLLQMLFRNEQLPIVVLRFYLVYGEGQSFTRFTPQLIKNCLLKSEFPMTRGEQIRDFCYVEDVVNGIMKALVIEDAKGEVINIASGKPMKIKSMVEKIIDIVGYGKPLYGAIEYRKGESMCLYADIKKAKKILDWEPKISIKNGLNKTINFYKKEFLK